jgi:DNA processing protein
MDTGLDLFRLHLLPGMTSSAGAALLARFGDAAAVLGASPEAVAAVPGVGADLAARLASPPGEGEARAARRRAERDGLRVLVLGDPDYPPRIGELPDPPLVLYVRGRPAPDDDAVAVVGARRASVYGRAVAERFGRALARAGLTVVSGLARGVDSVAHQAALDAGGRTVAVLGCGLDRVYPPENRRLAREIERTGAIYSELAPGTPPLAHHFPMRNRIIAALGRAAVVVEARPRSGSLITARLSAELGRQVFAVPGSVDSELSRGPHALIRDGAVLAEGPEQVLLDLGYRELTAEPESPPPEDPLQRRVLEALSSTEAVGADELLARLVVPAPALFAALLALELGGRIRSLPGHRFVKVAAGKVSGGGGASGED